MSEVLLAQGVDVFVWEGGADIALRVGQALEAYDAHVIHVDHMSGQLTPERDMTRLAVAVVSVTLMGDARFTSDWLTVQGIPVIWVAGQSRAHDPHFYPPEYAHILPLGFGRADLLRLIRRVVGLGPRSVDAVAAPSAATALVAQSDVMNNLLAEVRMFADCRSNVLLYGETGVGKERIAQLLHQAAPWRAGPFVAVNCGAVPEGLFEAHFFGHAKGAFTGAVGVHKGYFEQADGGTLFLDEIGDLPPYQQVKLLRVLEQSRIVRLGSSTEISVRFRLVAATNKALRALVASGEFRADLYYRLAVLELHIPNLQERGLREKQALFESLLRQHGATDPAPAWLLQRVQKLHFPGNVRELSNLAERVAIVRCQSGGWDEARLTRMIDARASVCAPPWSEPERSERARILAALQANAWRRQDTAHQLGISRKVLWEKIRKLRLEEENI